MCTSGLSVVAWKMSIFSGCFNAKGAHYQLLGSHENLGISLREDILLCCSSPRILDFCDIGLLTKVKIAGWGSLNIVIVYRCIILYVFRNNREENSPLMLAFELGRQLRVLLIIASFQGQKLIDCNSNFFKEFWSHHWKVLLPFGDHKIETNTTP